ncbi:MAG: N-acetylmuramoyl-L-alanine amidase [Myxococcota bacterium]
MNRALEPRRRLRAAAILPVLLLAAAARGEGSAVAHAPAGPDRLPPGLQTVVLDPGHGGSDFGARGISGTLEKTLSLRLARRIGSALEAEGVQVIYTRTDDRFVSLADRTATANRARADLFVSVHANSAPDARVSGVETYFLSLEASDDDARRVAMVENEVFARKDATPDAAGIVGDILGDLIRTDHLQRSSELAAAVQRALAPLPGPSRGVKQAPFAVLMGVNMPAILIESGFLTHAAEEQRLRAPAHQDAIARAVAAALVRDARDRAVGVGASR